jgi:uncharacterized protein YjbJ (UPF0337 family)
MTHHDQATKDARTEAKAVKHEGWMEESAGQAEKWKGQLTGNAAEAQEGAERQSAGNAMKHLGKMVEDQTKI